MSGWIGIGRSEVGLLRPTNQDAFTTMDPLGLWAVADGMGGHAGGEIAAQTAIATIKWQAEQLTQALEQQRNDPSVFLTELIIAAHHAILDRAKLDPSLKGMGTTVVLLFIHPITTPTAHIAHLGDSRAYLFRSGRLTALTRDHTLVEHYLERGILTPQMARAHPDRHILTQALGVSATVTPSLSSYPLREDDLLLLCTDGLTKMLDDDQISQICHTASGDPVRICDRLIGASIDRGGLDNVTVIVIARS